MIWPSNGRPKAKGSMMTYDSMMTVWVRKGLINQAMMLSENFKNEVYPTIVPFNIIILQFPVH